MQVSYVILMIKDYIEINLSQNNFDLHFILRHSMIFLLSPFITIQFHFLAEEKFNERLNGKRESNLNKI